MVRLSSSFFAAALSIVPLVSGAAFVKRGDTDTSTWEKYHQINELYSRIGRCMSYLEPSGRDGAWACGIYCKNENTKICQGPDLKKVLDSSINYNPDGKKWVQGECNCNTEVVDNIATTLVDFTAKGLDEGFRKLPALFCSTTINTVKEVATYGSYLIPGGGQVAAAARTMAKGIRLATKSEGGEDAWLQAVEDTCSILDFSSKGELQEAYHILKEAPDDFVEGED